MIEDEVVFRSLAAPGLEEDDLYAALDGLPVPGPFWGDGRPSRPREHEGWSEDADRRRRHAELMRRWRPESRALPETSHPS